MGVRRAGPRGGSDNPRGAVVNLVYPYSALKAPNVGGTREVLRLACRHGAKPVHHVSTNGIFPPDNGLCEEETDLDALAEAREDGYGRSKWVAEKLVREAARRGCQSASTVQATSRGTARPEPPTRATC